MILVVSDSFNRANTSVGSGLGVADTGQVWESIAGYGNEWRINNNQAHSGSVNSSSQTWLDSTLYDNFTLSIDAINLSNFSGQPHFIVFRGNRVTGTTMFVRFDRPTRQVRIGIGDVFSRTFTIRASSPNNAIPEGIFNLKVIAEGHNHQLFIDDVLILNHTRDEGTLFGTMFGFSLNYYSNQFMTVDNLKIERPRQPEDDFEWIDNGNNTATITGYIGASKDITIPNVIDGLTVTHIGDSAFSESQITSITMPNSVTSIGQYAFRDNNLTSVNISSNVMVIGDLAFVGNPLDTIVVSGSNPNFRDIGGNGLYTKDGLSLIRGTSSGVIAETTNIIKSRAFNGNQLISIVIPNSVTHIESFSFEGNQLTSIDIGNNVIFIGNSAFIGNKLTDVTIFNESVIIEVNAFANNQTIPANLTIIGHEPSTANNYANTNNHTFQLLVVLPLIPISVKVSNSWIEIDEGFVKVDDVWREVENAFINIDGVWQSLDGK